MSAITPRIHGWTTRIAYTDPPFEPADGQNQFWMVATTSNDEHLETAVDALARQYPEATIGFLTQTDLLEEVQGANPRAVIIHSPRNGFFGMNITPSLVSQLRSRCIDRFLILYRNADGDRHKRVELLALLSGAIQVYGYDVEGGWWYLPQRYLLFSLIRPLIESKPVKALRALYYNVTFPLFLAAQAVAIRINKRIEP